MRCLLLSLLHVCLTKAAAPSCNSEGGDACSWNVTDSLLQSVARMSLNAREIQDALCKVKLTLSEDKLQYSNLGGQGPDTGVTEEISLTDVIAGVDHPIDMHVFSTSDDYRAKTPSSNRISGELLRMNVESGSSLNFRIQFSQNGLITQLPSDLLLTFCDINEGLHNSGVEMLTFTKEYEYRVSDDTKLKVLYGGTSFKSGLYASGFAPRSIANVSGVQKHMTVTIKVPAGSSEVSGQFSASGGMEGRDVFLGGVSSFYCEPAMIAAATTTPSTTMYNVESATKSATKAISTAATTTPSTTMYNVESTTTSATKVNACSSILDLKRPHYAHSGEFIALESESDAREVGQVQQGDTQGEMRKDGGGFMTDRDERVHMRFQNVFPTMGSVVNMEVTFQGTSQVALGYHNNGVGELEMQAVPEGASAALSLTFTDEGGQPLDVGPFYLTFGAIKARGGMEAVDFITGGPDVTVHEDSFFEVSDDGRKYTASYPNASVNGTRDAMVETTGERRSTGGKTNNEPSREIISDVHLNSKTSSDDGSISGWLSGLIFLQTDKDFFEVRGEETHTTLTALYGRSSSISILFSSSGTSGVRRWFFTGPSDLVCKEATTTTTTEVKFADMRTAPTPVPTPAPTPVPTPPPRPCMRSFVPLASPDLPLIPIAAGDTASDATIFTNITRVDYERIFRDSRWAYENTFRNFTNYSVGNYTRVNKSGGTVVDYTNVSTFEHIVYTPVPTAAPTVQPTAAPTLAPTMVPEFHEETCSNSSWMFLSANRVNRLGEHPLPMIVDNVFPLSADHTKLIVDAQVNGTLLDAGVHGQLGYVTLKAGSLARLSFTFYTESGVLPSMYFSVLDIDKTASYVDVVSSVYPQEYVLSETSVIEVFDQHRFHTEFEGTGSTPVKARGLSHYQLDRTVTFFMEGGCTLDLDFWAAANAGNASNASQTIYFGGISDLVCIGPDVEPCLLDDTPVPTPVPTPPPTPVPTPKPTNWVPTPQPSTSTPVQWPTPQPTPVPTPQPTEAPTWTPFPTPVLPCYADIPDLPTPIPCPKPKLPTHGNSMAALAMTSEALLDASIEEASARKGNAVLH